MTKEFRIGDVIQGEVTGIQNYGVFVKLSDTEQGLVHISECKHGYVSELDDFINIGDKVKVKIIDIDEYTRKISLSFRALQHLNTPPFPSKSKKYPKRYLPKIGFKTLGQNMPKIIEDGLRQIEEDQTNILGKNEERY
ncbi:MAG: CvfD/Ygs/GSP13 family RNA-binding post-transcriptional regulator [Ruoffia tabacinasalis]|uniref:S1 RNA-binding domain-containing protein n=1 Tax=Ruoffia tabacinasalis TaxID=87458 RepID=A0A5R9DUV8_9LACT|nr:CvfD/Ygs/GSP13 family RNA-binding post-transcriptional regulator [Ruoffia tabacinasalis]TLQ39619.1 S1 RNA-binding domain-containing protein [Ruoffia tabacinasalis]